MALRTGHGNGAGAPHIEVLPPDELPDGVAASSRPIPRRDAAGRLLPGPGAAELGRRGAMATKESRKLAQLLGLWEPPEDHAYSPYARLAREWRDEHIARLSQTVGGGEVGPGPASIVSTAALQMGASRYLYDVGARTGDATILLQASRLADSSRQNLLAAHELCAREAKAKQESSTELPPWFQKEPTQ